MKLEDLCKSLCIPMTDEEYEIEKTVISLCEMFDTTFPIQWQTYIWGEEGGVSIEGLPYVFQLRTRREAGRDIADVSFYRADLKNTGREFGTQQTLKYPGAVYGILINALLEKRTDYDGFLFDAIRENSPNDHEQRVRIYDFIAHKLWRNSMSLYSKAGSDKSSWLLLKKELGDNERGGWGDGTSNLKFPEFKRCAK